MSESERETAELKRANKAVQLECAILKKLWASFQKPRRNI